ncbi:hypothetical protein [Kitasatospora sp. NPDC098663]|uniref:hypothetical protein n=1 Tax=Kitasatospora sp. NPDC098663 TaxID=3364096 RepID=UPI00381B3394
MDTVTHAQFHSILDEVLDSAVGEAPLPVSATCPTCRRYGPVEIGPDTVHGLACGHTLLWPDSCRESVPWPPAAGSTG